MKPSPTSLFAAIFASFGLASSGWCAGNPSANDYPTSARVDYVIACMAANGETREAMDRCSCSVDVIASIMSYDDYVKAETILAMRQGVGQQAGMFRAVRQLDDIVANLRRTQAEAEVRCFK